VGDFDVDISEVTRRNIFDELSVANVCWSGRLDEPAFLSRLFDLASLPSTDFRYRGAERDIFQHRVRNADWANDWVFTDSRFNLTYGGDEVFLRFLCETLHPVVRADAAEVESLRELFNRHLSRDGWELYPQTTLSGRPVFAARCLLPGEASSLNAAKEVATALTGDYISQQVTRLEAALKGDPELVIGTAKEFVETVCKSILGERGVTPEEEWNFPRLVQETRGRLQMLPAQVDQDVEGGRTLRALLQSLTTLTQSLAELRGNYGTGHGKSADAQGLELRHARLAVNAAVTLCVFLFETHQTLPGPGDA
jgi:hypothetical protein